jgi:hypothetical protein
LKVKYWENILAPMVPSCDADGLNGLKIRMGPLIFEYAVAGS